METLAEKLENNHKKEEEESLNKKIEEVRKKNQEREKKFKEAEEDRKKAEKEGCAVILKQNQSKLGIQTQKEWEQSQRKNKNKKKYLPATSDEWREYVKNKELEEQKMLHLKEEKTKNSTKKTKTTSTTTPNNSIDENLIISKNLMNNKKIVRVSDKALKYTPKRPVSAEHGDKPPPPDPSYNFLADSYRDASDETQTDRKPLSNQINRQHNTVYYSNNIKNRLGSKNSNNNQRHFNNHTYHNQQSYQHNNYYGPHKSHGYNGTKSFNNKKPDTKLVTISTNNQASSPHQPPTDVSNNQTVSKQHVRSNKPAGSGRLVERRDDFKSETKVKINTVPKTKIIKKNNGISRDINNNIQNSIDSNGFYETKPLKSILKKQAKSYEENEVESFVAVITTPGDEWKPEHQDDDHGDEDDWEDVEEDEANSPVVSNKVEVFPVAEVVVSHTPPPTPNITTTINNDVATTVNTGTSNREVENTSETNPTKVLSTIVNSSSDLNELDKDLSDEETHESFQKFIEENTLRVDPNEFAWTNDLSTGNTAGNTLPAA